MMNHWLVQTGKITPRRNYLSKLRLGHLFFAAKSSNFAENLSKFRPFKTAV